MDDLFPLDMLSPGETACIKHVLGEPAQVQRLNELGLQSGTKVEVIQPGTPCIVRIDGGGKLCLREGNEVTVLVSRGGDS